MKKNKSQQILDILRTLYPDAQSELNFKNNYQLIIAVVLSAQCTDKKVNDVTKDLFKTYPNFKSLANSNLKEVEAIIKQVNYYKTKAKNIINLAKQIINEFDNKVPTKIEELIKLSGVGRKTASVVQSEIGVDPALPVDTHVFRVSKRLGLAKGNNVLEVEDELKKVFKKQDWRQLHHSLIFHGRRVCKAQKPDCYNCQLNNLCEKRY